MKFHVLIAGSSGINISLYVHFEYTTEWRMKGRLKDER